MVQLKVPIIILLLGAVVYYLCHSPSVSQDVLKEKLADKVVLICGSSSGIGEEIAYNLATLGAKLILVSRTASKLEVIKQNALEKDSPGVEIIPFDLSDTSSSQDLVTKAVALFGGIDHVILNHAEFPTLGRFLDIKQHQDPRYIEKVFRTNFFSHVQLTLAVLPHLEQNGGHIIVTSSGAGETPMSLFTLYSSTKHAMNGFFYSLQQELKARSSKVTLSIAALGYIKTKANEEILESREDNDMPELFKGDLTECAMAMIQSLVTRVKTVTYPRIGATISRVLWFTSPYLYEKVVTGPMEKDVQRAAADIIEYSKKTGWQAGNFGIDDKKP